MPIKVAEVIYLGNFALADTTDSDGILDNPSLYAGTFGSAANPLSSDEVDVTIDQGFVSNVYTDDSALTTFFPHTHSFSPDGGATTVTSTVDSVVRANATVTYLDGSMGGVENIILYQDNLGNMFLSNSDFYGANLTPSRMGIESIMIFNINIAAEGATLPFDQLITNAFQDFVCFTKGTKIETESGEIAIEDLAVGDMVITSNGEPKPIRWIGRKSLSSTELAVSENLRPVRITAGALGNNLPACDLLVSRQHRMVVSSAISKRMFEAADVLIPSIKLTELPGIYVDNNVESVEYFHILFDQHEVIFAEGAPSESLYTGPESLKAVSPEMREEILTLFPEVAELDYSPEPAMLIPSNARQKTLIERHIRNDALILSNWQRYTSPR